jgi:hypothetical protein
VRALSLGSGTAGDSIVAAMAVGSSAMRDRRVGADRARGRVGRVARGEDDPLTLADERDRSVEFEGGRKTGKAFGATPHLALDDLPLAIQCPAVEELATSELLCVVEETAPVEANPYEHDCSVAAAEHAQRSGGRIWSLRAHQRVWRRAPHR